MKKRNRSRPVEQSDLFALRASGWVARHWPSYSAGASSVTQPTPIEAWAATIEGLPAGAQQLLGALAAIAQANSLMACCTIADLAVKTSASQNATRARLDRLLSAGLVLVRPRIGPRPSGYDLQLLVDEDDRARALQAGFTAKRAAFDPKRERTHG